MTPTECIDLIKFIAGRCPAMRMQDNTPETWYVDLVGFDLPDAIEAARRASLSKTFIGIGDLVTECQAVVRHRAGVEARARLEAQIAAENGGIVPDPVLSGGPHPDVQKAIEAPLHDRVDIYRESRKASFAERQVDAAAKAEARRLHDERLAEARAQLAELRKQASGE